MSLRPGTRLGPYLVLAPLGVGGMGEVWRARDTRLDREVAVKVLSPGVADVPDRISRFAREARVLAQLRHPAIAALHSFEEVDGRPLLVMELAEGETLAERIAAGPLPLGEALSIARQIGEALEEAHEKGIVHRDLKPANVKVSTDGKVKLLDFGLAKAWAPEPSSSGSSDEAAGLETMTTDQTTPGAVVGTVSYMAPEQARGRPVDKRADIWAFGVVLFEMITGQRLFARETPSDVVVAVLTHEPDWALLPAGTPDGVRRLLRRCLTRDTRNRLHDIADARLELGDSEFSGQAAAAPAPAASVEVRSPHATGRARAGRAALVAALVVAAAAASAFLAARRARTEPPVFRNLTWSHGDVFSARLTPDGENVVYSAAFDGRPLALYSARLDAIESRPLDLPAGDVVGISRSAEMALLTAPRNVGSWKRVGTLTRASLSGGSPKPVLEDVFAADISPDGSAFAVVRAAAPGQQLEYPVGRVVHRSRGWISHPRISPDGQRVAFIDHDVDGDDLGSVSILERDGRVERLSPQLDYSQGLAWSPSSEEVWATSYRVEEGALLQAFSPRRPTRVLLRVPSTVRILDAAGDGRVLMTYDDTHVELEGRLAGDPAMRPYSWWRASFVTGIAHDGALFSGDGAMSLEKGGSAAFYRRAGGSPPVRLGAGFSAGVSPDGRWVFLTPTSGRGSRLQAVPTGPGEPREFELGPVEALVSGTRVLSYSVDGKLLGFTGTAGGSDLRGFVLDLQVGGVPRAVTPEGVDEVLLSPDGASMAGVARGKGVMLFPIGPQNATPLAGTTKHDLPVAWESTSKALFVWDRGIPLRVFRVDLATGERTLALEVSPRDPTGVLYGHVRFTPDLAYFLFRFRRHTSYLAVVTGVK
ncbi:MAG: protein kinase [Holophagales bacterium]|nr:protein kinase [Holophagales bacterium]